MSAKHTPGNSESDAAMQVITVRQARNIAKSLGIRAACNWLKCHQIKPEIAAYWLTGSVRFLP